MFYLRIELNIDVSEIISTIASEDTVDGCGTENTGEYSVRRRSLLKEDEMIMLGTPFRSNDAHVSGNIGRIVISNTVLANSRPVSRKRSTAVSPSLPFCFLSFFPNVPSRISCSSADEQSG